MGVLKKYLFLKPHPNTTKSESLERKLKGNRRGNIFGWIHPLLFPLLMINLDFRNDTHSATQPLSWLGVRDSQKEAGLLDFSCKQSPFLVFTSVMLLLVWRCWKVWQGRCRALQAWGHSWCCCVYSHWIATCGGSVRITWEAFKGTIPQIFLFNWSDVGLGLWYF